MVFNADTYYANKYRRQAWETLAKVRDIRERHQRGEAYYWEPGRMPLLITEARTLMHLSVLYRGMGKTKNKQRKVRVQVLT